ncbi:MAG: anti-sigma factor [Acidimicrobiia bacterium]|nr:anti-sigma factor [Acidimicrobiia bacterium]MDH4305846.1 anti-sigma factor [Acidimicrobiia bacterium]MDH5293711.1 anti-sigma factor [Acidimicrobiia bacterium]
MTCEQCQTLYLAGDVGPAVESHMAGCASCRSSRSALDRLRNELADPTLWELPAPDLAERVVAEVSAKANPAGRPGRRGRVAGSIVAAVAAVAVIAAGVVAGRSPAPDWEVALVAGETARGASAHVEGWLVDGTTRMRFDVSGVEPLGPDEYYEVWLTADDGRHVSAGSFTSDGVFETSIGVARSDYPRVWVTREPVDDDLGPSRTVIFDNPGYGR